MMDLSSKMIKIIEDWGYTPESLIESIRINYLKDHHSTYEVAQILQVSQSFVKRVINECGFKKSDDQINQEMVAKMQSTNLQKYGVTNSLNLPSAVSKLEDTNLRKYGSKRPFGNQDIQNKAHQSQMNLYGGVGNASPELLLKYKSTNLKLYGAENPMQNPEIATKSSTSRLEQYSKGSKALKNSRIAREVTRGNMTYNPDFDTLYNPMKFKELVNSVNSIEDLANSLGVGYSCIRNYAHEYNISLPRSSQTYPEQELEWLFTHLNLIEGLDYLVHHRKVLNNKYELDFYFPKLNLGIEYNGTYYHCDRPFYHKEKSDYARSLGISIYHIFEHEWLDPIKREIIESQIKSLLHKQNNIIYARNCILSNNISSEEATKFLKINHVQGSRGSKYRYGLYHRGELVALMTFGENYFIRKTHDLELLRFCTKLYTNVIGGASKLLYHFVEDHKPLKIYSYCDLSKGRGTLYDLLGFQHTKSTNPNYKWVRWSDNDVKTRYQCQMKNEQEIMRSQGYVQVWDCGSAEYLFSKSY